MYKCTQTPLINAHAQHIRNIRCAKGRKLTFVLADCITKEIGFLKTVISKFQIESYCQISHHSINRFKSFGQISNIKYHFFPQILNLLEINLKSNLKSLIFVLNLTLCTLIFHNIKNNVIHVWSVGDHSQLLQYSLSKLNCM